MIVFYSCPDNTNAGNSKGETVSATETAESSGATAAKDACSLISEEEGKVVLESAVTKGMSTATMCQYLSASEEINCSLSKVTTGANSYKRERYVIFWKPSSVTLIGKPWLEKKFNLEIDREPFYATFKCAEKEFTVVNFHAITKNLQPETEIKYFKYLPAQYSHLNLIFLGDFNLPQTHSVFSPLKKMGYKAALANQKTSLKQNCKKDDCLVNQFDNCFYNSKNIKHESSGVIHFYRSFSDFKNARNISDHLPVVVRFKCK